MSYDSKYTKWVESIIKGFESKDVYQVYRGVPILRVKTSDNPPQYNYMSPLGANTDIDKLRARLDKRVDSELKAAKKLKEGKSSDELNYFKKWEDCQMELELYKKREKETLTKLKELQGKVDEISAAKIQLEKEASYLRNQVKELQKKLSK